MTTMLSYAALLRAVNVGGRGTVAMAGLRDLFVRLGMEDVRTVLNSGNVVFRCGPRDGASLERLFTSATRSQLGLETEVFVRRAAAWKGVIARNPFAEEARTAPARLVVMFLKHRVTPGQLRKLQAGVTGPERVGGSGTEVYIVYPGGIGRSRVTPGMIESSLGIRGTGRNWNTVLRLQGLLQTS